jgi:capsular polysaccharide export protein
MPERYNALSEAMVAVPRAGQLSTEGGEILSWLNELRQNGSRILCALGKIPYDLAVPYQGGPAHQDISDWINHTVETVGKTENTMLLIKPHPHELNYAISHKPNETFVDLITNYNCLPQNIRILPYHGISIQHLIQVVDCFLCWNGSSIAEIGALGSKIIAADDWAAKNYPVDVMMPKDRAHYEQLLRGEITVEMHPLFQSKSRAYISYLTEAPFALKYPLVGRSSNNTNFNQAWVNWDHFNPAAIASLERYQCEIAAAFYGMDRKDGSNMGS